MALTKRQIEVLALLLKSEDREIVCDGRYCMVDLESVSRGTVNALLGHMAIKDAGYSGVGCDIYIPTQNAPQIIARPDLADEMVTRVMQNKPFYVDATGTIQDADQLSERTDHK